MGQCFPMSRRRATCLQQPIVFDDMFFCMSIIPLQAKPYVHTKKQPVGLWAVLAFVKGIEPPTFRLGAIRDFENGIKTIDFLQISFVLSRFMRAKTSIVLSFVK